MAATAISLQLRPKRRPITNPTFLHFFSSPNPSDSTDVDDQNSPPPQSPFSSYFSDVKSIFKQIQFLEEISKNLSQFRRPSPAPPPRDKSSPAATPQISFQELYKRRSENSTIEASNEGSKSSFEDIRESLRQLRMNNPTNSNNNTTIEASDKGSKPSFEDFRKSLRQDNPTNSNNTTIKVSNKGSKFEAIRESLHQLRMNNPTNNNNNQQGVDLRQSLMEKEMESKFVGFGFTDLRQSLMALRPALEQREEQEANVRRSENSTIQASNKGSGGGPSFDAIRESLHQLKINKSNSNNNHQINNNRDPMSLKTLAQDLKLLLGGPNNVIGGTDQRLPASVFGKEEEMREKEQESPAMRTKFVRGYSYEELGKKLRMLRPPEGKRGGDWFSLGELNERLMKLREVEEKEEKYVGVSFSDLRQSLVRMQLSSEENNKKQMCE